uniref:ShKT domain-containing protein n=1 Tax=Elaeophora elaphi TaxID=1147741 RepID=A0A0R3RGL8_9BILA
NKKKHFTNSYQIFETIFNNIFEFYVNFWKVARDVSDISDVMVPTSSLKTVLNLLHMGNVNVTVTIPDVEGLIIKREKKKNIFEQQRYRDDSRTNSRSKIESVKYDFYSYGSYKDMMEWLRSLATKYPNFVRYISIGKSHEKRSIDGLEIGGANQSKRVFWIDGGIHAREWAAPHTALYFIHELTSKYGHDKQITKYVDELTWVIVPCLNPDGYEYTRSSTNPNIRLWRKNRSPSICGKDSWGRSRCCRGVDLNRNFDFHFKESGSSDDPCAEIYQGKSAFSEPETKAVRDAIMSSRYRGRVDAFVTLHTYSQIWIHPYGHRKDTYPGDIQDLYEVGKKATNALSKLYGTKYVVGSGADTLYPASGGSEDWAKQTAGVKYVYLLELRPDEKNWDGFILDERQLIPTATETWAGIRVVADAVIERAYQKIARNNANKKRGEKGTIKQQYRFGNGSTGSCYDLRHACKRWVREKESICQTVPIFMREQCAYSCGHC